MIERDSIIWCERNRPYVLETIINILEKEPAKLTTVVLNQRMAGLGFSPLAIHSGFLELAGDHRIDLPQDRKLIVVPLQTEKV